MNNNNRKNMSGFDRKAIDIMSCIVADQHMKLDDGEGHIWESNCKDIAGAQMSVTTITRDGKVMARICYDYDEGKEIDLDEVTE